MKKIIFSALLAFSGIGVANAAVDCDLVQERADQEGKFFEQGVTKKVVQQGRLYFHTAPHSECKTPKVFIIKNDLAKTYAHYNGYDFIIYRTKAGHDISGWVKANALSTDLKANPITSEEAAIKAVEKSVMKHKLLSSLDCTGFYVQEDKETYEIDIREVHNKQCGGDEATAPRLLSYTVNKKTGEMCTGSMIWAERVGAEDPTDFTCRPID